MNFLKKNQVSITWIFAITILIFIFLHRLGDTPLFSYDEAWYAEIARNILITKNPFHLLYNGSIFTDHPPFGFQLMALAGLLFGTNEFSARIVSAILGIGTTIVVFFIGRKLKNSLSGFLSAIILISSTWFMYRARSGNLDIPFLFWESLTVLLLLQKGKRYIYYASLAFAFMFMTKTLIGVGLIPVILYLLFFYRNDVDKKMFLKFLILALTIIIPWYLYNQVVNSNFLYHHFLEIGTRSEKNSFALSAIVTSLKFLSYGIGKWFWAFIPAIMIGLIDFAISKKSRQLWLTLLLWFAGFSVFLVSSKTEIWHLLPLYPVISLLIPISMLTLIEHLPQKAFFKYSFVFCTIILSLYQFLQLRTLLYPSGRPYSAEKDISLKAAKYTNLSLMELFLPASVYYSAQNVRPLYWESDAYQTLITLLRTKKGDVIVTNNKFKADLEKDNVIFKVLEKNDSYYLVTGN